MNSSERDQLRSVFFSAWQKHKAKKIVEPLEAQIIEIILLHPEYHALLDDPEKYKLVDFDETNPFLHLSLHLAIREQINTNRPAGIKSIYEKLSADLQDKHVAEHKMLACLEKVLWEAQQSGRMPEEEVYLDYLRRI